MRVPSLVTWEIQILLEGGSWKKNLILKGSLDNELSFLSSIHGWKKGDWSGNLPPFNLNKGNRFGILPFFVDWNKFKCGESQITDCLFHMLTYSYRTKNGFVIHIKRIFNLICFLSMISHKWYLFQELLSEDGLLSRLFIETAVMRGSISLWSSKFQGFWVFFRNRTLVDVPINLQWCS